MKKKSAAVCSLQFAVLQMSFFVLYKQQDKIFFSANRGFHMSLTTQQPKGRCVWGARAIILVTRKHFAKK